MGIKDKANELKDKAMDKAKGAIGDDGNVDKAAGKIDEATGNKFSDQIDKGADAAKKANDKLCE